MRSVVTLALEQLDPGIRDCILARFECRGYEYRVAHETRARTGAFALAPHNERTEREVNPLGPLQGLGDSVSGLLLK